MGNRSSNRTRRREVEGEAAMNPLRRRRRWLFSGQDRPRVDLTDIEAEMRRMFEALDELRELGDAALPWMQNVEGERRRSFALQKRARQLQEQARKVQAEQDTGLCAYEALETPIVTRVPHRLPRSLSLESRLNSFADWPLWAAADPVQLAEQGFRYTGDRDCIQCDGCGVGYIFFDPEDENPLAHHLHEHPDCVYAQRMREVLHGQLQTDHTLPGVPRDQDFHRRVDTFRQWPVWAQQRPQDLASYGYVYIGLLDITYCESCELRVQNWRREDNAFESLARHASSCAFVIQFFGEKPEEGKWGLLHEAAVELAEPVGFWERWFSFLNWPRTARVPPRDLALQGFRYTQNDDYVICKSCDLTLISLNETCDVLAMHRARRERCPFVLAADVSVRKEKTGDTACAAATSRSQDAALLPPLVQQLQVFDAPRQLPAPPSEDEQMLCILCFSAVPCVLYQLCAHAVTCASCAAELPDCPVCREPATVKEHFRLGRAADGTVLVTCSSCGEHKVTHLLDPCRHVTVCDQCVSKVEECPQCGAEVQEVQRIYLL